MNYLLDTHAFLWYCTGSPEMSATARQLIDDKKNRMFLSMASLWEISIKTALNKLEISGPYELVMDDVTGNDIELLPIGFAHTVKQNQLPFFHRDPFDRMIVSQSLVKGINLISKDEILDGCFVGQSVRRVW